MGTQTATPAPMTTPQFEGLKKWGYAPGNIGNLTKKQASELLSACAQKRHRVTGEELVAMTHNEIKQEQIAIQQRGVLEPSIADKELDKLFGDLPENVKEDEVYLRKELKAAAEYTSVAAAELGRVLEDYKTTIPYGKWLPFLTIIGIPPRLAQRYMQLADDVKAVKHAGLTHALQAKGISLTAGGHNSEAHEIARKAVELATELERKKEQANASPGTYSGEDFGPPPLSNEEQIGIIETAIEAVRPTPVAKPAEALEIAPERSIGLWEHKLDEALKGLRDAINDDQRFRQVVKSHWEAVWSA